MRLVAIESPPLTGGKTVKFGHKGIDKLVLSFPVASFPTKSASHWKHTASGRWNSARTRAGREKGQMLSVHMSQQVASAEFSLTPSYVYGLASNTHVPSDDCVPELAAFAHDVAIEWGIIPTCAPGEMRIKQIDLTRNLTLAPGIAPSDYLHGLSSVTPTHARLKNLYLDPATNRTETLLVGSKTSRLVRIYDKLEESGDPAARGIIRWEAQLKNFLASRGIRTVADATPDLLEAIRTELFKWSGMENHVVGPADAVYRVREAVRQERITAQQARSLLGSAVLGQQFQGERSTRRANAALRRLGIATDLAQLAEVLRSGDRWEYRADYYSGMITGGRIA